VKTGHQALSGLALKQAALATCLFQSKNAKNLSPHVTPEGVWEEDFQGARTDVACF
jgi:hypothetical protein